LGGGGAGGRFAGEQPEAAEFRGFGDDGAAECGRAQIFGEGGGGGKVRRVGGAGDGAQQCAKRPDGQFVATDDDEALRV
jgi:hypothetical protein